MTCNGTQRQSEAWSSTGEHPGDQELGPSADEADDVPEAHQLARSYKSSKSSGHVYGADEVQEALRGLTLGQSIREACASGKDQSIEWCSILDHRHGVLYNVWFGNSECLKGWEWLYWVETTSNLFITSRSKIVFDPDTNKTISYA